MINRSANLSFYVAAGALVALVVGVVPFLDERNLWLMGVPVAVPLIFFVLTKMPMFLVAALPFVGLFKPTAAQGFSYTDPTFITVALCGLVLAAEVLFAVSGVRKPSLDQRFAGQYGAVLAFFSLVTVAFLSFSYTQAPHLGLPKLERLLIISTFLFIAPLVLMKSEQDFNGFAKAFVLLGVAVALKTVFQIFHPDPRVTEITQINAGQAIGISILVLVFYDWGSSKRGRLLKFGIPILGAGLLASVARGPIVSTGAALLAGFVLRSDAQSRLKKMMLAIPIMAIAALLAILWVQVLSSVNEQFFKKEVDKTRELTTMLSGSLETGASGGKRIVFYEHAARAFAQRPILGWGIGGWTVAQNGYEATESGAGAFNTEYPHNIILEVAVEEGLIGLTALGTLILAYWKTLRSLLHWAEGKYAFVVPVCIYCVLICMFSDDINNRLLWAWLGAALVASRLCRSAQPVPSMRGMRPVATPTFQPQPASSAFAGSAATQNLQWPRT